MKAQVTLFRSIFQKSLCVAAAAIALAQVSASASLLTAGVDLGAAKNYTVLTLGGADSMQGNSTVRGNFGVGGSSTLSLQGNSTIDGNLYLKNLGDLTVKGNAEVLGGTYFNNASKSSLQQALLDAQSASQRAFNLASSCGYPKEIFSNQSLTLNGSGTVVLKLSDFIIGGNASLTLRGNSSTTFIINVKDQFSLSGNSQIKLMGGLSWDNVLFNVRGSGSVNITGSSSLSGILLATGRTVYVSGTAQVHGEIIASNVVLSGSTVVNQPPTVSP